MKSASHYPARRISFCLITQLIRRVRADIASRPSMKRLIKAVWLDIALRRYRESPSTAQPSLDASPITSLMTDHERQRL